MFNIDLLKPEIITSGDLDQIEALYNSVKGMPYCTWNEDYPVREYHENDINDGRLYGYKNQDGIIIAAMAIDRDEEVDKLPCWNKEWMPAAEIARLVVSPEYQNLGIARKLHRDFWPLLQEKGFKSVHYLLAADNLKARKSYEKLGYSYCGETVLFGINFEAYEMQLQPGAK